VFLALCLRLVVSIINYERRDNLGSKIITVCELFYDTSAGIEKSIDSVSNPKRPD